MNPIHCQLFNHHAMSCGWRIMAALLQDESEKKNYDESEQWSPRQCDYWQQSIHPYPLEYVWWWSWTLLFYLLFWQAEEKWSGRRSTVPTLITWIVRILRLVVVSLGDCWRDSRWTGHHWTDHDTQLKSDWTRSELIVMAAANIKV